MLVGAVQHLDDGLPDPGHPLAAVPQHGERREYAGRRRPITPAPCDRPHPVIVSPPKLTVKGEGRTARCGVSHLAGSGDVEIRPGVRIPPARVHDHLSEAVPAARHPRRGRCGRRRGRGDPPLRRVVVGRSGPRPPRVGTAGRAAARPRPDRVLRCPDGRQPVHLLRPGDEEVTDADPGGDRAGEVDRRCGRAGRAVPRRVLRHQHPGTVPRRRPGPDVRRTGQCGADHLDRGRLRGPAARWDAADLHGVRRAQGGAAGPAPRRSPARRVPAVPRADVPARPSTSTPPSSTPNSTFPASSCGSTPTGTPATSTPTRWTS